MYKRKKRLKEVKDKDVQKKEKKNVYNRNEKLNTDRKKKELKKYFY